MHLNVLHTKLIVQYHSLNDASLTYDEFQPCYSKTFFSNSGASRLHNTTKKVRRDVTKHFHRRNSLILNMYSQVNFGCWKKRK